jgi:aryl-alcohol dehydrogenase-like predicted oxidoreductase
MEYRNLGQSGLKVSLAGLGCNNFGGRIDESQTGLVVQRALDEGITFFDTADIYGGQGRSEEWLGKSLGARRRDVIIATKFGMPMGEGPYHRGTSRRYAILCCEDSLRRLGTDYIDLYQVHAPDPSTPEQETLEALDLLVRSGKVRYIGCSNYAAWQLADAVGISRQHGLTSYISAQNQYNLLDRGIERELLPASRHFGVGMLPYFPLASGFLTGKYRRGAEISKDTRFGNMKRLADQVLNEANFATLERLEYFARSREHSLLELAVGWLAARSEVSSIICGATRPEQVTENIAALSWKLTSDDLKEIDRLVPLS